MNALFVCIHNAGRSQIAEAIAKRLGINARSAGSNPAERVHPEVVEAMREVGIDLSGRSPHALSQDDADWADVVVTMGCGDACPILPGKRYIEWDIPDPKGRPIDEIRTIRDEIESRLRSLCK